MTCPHITRITSLPHPKLSQSVHREECTQCFDNQDLPSGIELCLICFNGACPRLHAPIHAHKSNHPFSINIRRVANNTADEHGRNDDEPPPMKMTKLAIQEEPSEDKKYQFLTTIKCWTCDPVSGLSISEAANDSKVTTCSFVVFDVHVLTGAR